MNAARRWQDVKAEAHRRHPELADPERQAKARTELDAYIAGHYLEELRQSIGKPQAEVAEVLGASPSCAGQGLYAPHPKAQVRSEPRPMP